MGKENDETIDLLGHKFEWYGTDYYHEWETFTFEGVRKKGLLNELIYESKLDSYTKKAMELMERHYAFYKELEMTEHDYVTKGAILVCTHGNKYTLLDICKDHGVYYQNQPILTCNDYKPEENIFSFGACGNNRFEPVYSNEAPHPRDTVADLNGDERYKCFPVLLDGWGCGVAKERQKGCCISNKSDIEYNKKKLEQLQLNVCQNTYYQEEYIEALKSHDNLLCVYGGVITISEIQNDFNKVIDDNNVQDNNDALDNNEVIDENTKEINIESEYKVQYKFQYDWMKKGLKSSNYVTPEFLEKVISISEELGINPDDLLSVMAYESWITPNAENSGGAYGLIQFTNTSIKGINENNGTNYTKEDIKKMDIMQQLELTYLHLEPNAGKMYDLGDVYLAVIAPNRLSGNLTTNDTVVYSLADSSKYYKSNKGLDTDGDGIITKGELCQKVIERREKYYIFE